MIVFPTSVEPVKPILRTPGCSDNTWPVISPGRLPWESQHELFSIIYFLMLNGEQKHQGSASNLHQQPTYCEYKIIYNYTMSN